MSATLGLPGNPWREPPGRRSIPRTPPIRKPMRTPPPRGRNLRTYAPRDYNAPPWAKLRISPWWALRTFSLAIPLILEPSELGIDPHEKPWPGTARLSPRRIPWTPQEWYRRYEYTNRSPLLDLSALRSKRQEVQEATLDLERFADRASINIESGIEVISVSPREVVLAPTHTARRIQGEVIARQIEAEAAPRPEGIQAERVPVPSGQYWSRKAQVRIWGEAVASLDAVADATNEYLRRGRARDLEQAMRDAQRLIDENNARLRRRLSFQDEYWADQYRRNLERRRAEIEAARLEDELHAHQEALEQMRREQDAIDTRPAPDLEPNPHVDPPGVELQLEAPDAARLRAYIPRAMPSPVPALDPARTSPRSPSDHKLKSSWGKVMANVLTAIGHVTETLDLAEVVSANLWLPNSHGMNLWQKWRLYQVLTARGERPSVYFDVEGFMRDLTRETLEDHVYGRIGSGMPAGMQTGPWDDTSWIGEVGSLDHEYRDKLWLLD